MQKYWIWLSRLPGVGDGQRRMLLEHFSDAEAVWQAGEQELKAYGELPADAVAAILDKDLSEAEAVILECNRKGLHILTADDPAYPSRLRNIFDPPVVLYYKGTLPDFEEAPAIGIVGTRHPSIYGFDSAYRIGYEIAAGGGIVVSGMALGIDAAAMNGALAAGKAPVGVLGCGADIVYPVSNRQLFADTERTGCILSEFLPGTPAAKWTFPRRNRIISGLSCGVVVVESPEKSGSLITADRALEQGRDVYAVPGNIDMPGFVGSNRLLRSGATAIGTGWDVLSEYEHLFPGKLTAVAASEKLPPHPAGNRAAGKTAKVAQKTALPREDSDLKKQLDKKSIDKAEAASYIDVAETLTGLSPDEQAVMTALGEEEQLVDALIEATGLTAGRVLSILTMLEIKGIVKRHPGRRVSLKIGKP